MKRIFLALKAKIYDYDKLQSDFAEVIKGNWTTEENMHVTVCYFGELYEIDNILQKMPSLKNKIKDFQLTSLGYFKHNNILYAKATSRELEILQSSISKLFSLPQSRPYVIHVTLMRIKEFQDKKAFKKILSDYNDKTIGIVDSNFELMNSYIQNSGRPRYESIRKF